MKININLKVPEKWDDLTEWQLSKIGKILRRDQAEEKAVIRYMLLFVLLIPKPSLKVILKIGIMLTQVPIKALLPHTDFLFDNDKGLTNFRRSFEVKSRWFWRETLYGPSQRLANISILELSYADTFFYNWITEGKDVDLDRLCGILYRPTGPGATASDLRKYFDRHMLQKNARLTDKIPIHHKYMIALAYQGTRAIFARRYPHVFPKSKKPSIPDSNKKPQYYPFTKIIDAMVLDEIQPFGPLDQTEKTNADRFLGIYNESIIRQKDAEKRLKKK